MSAYYEPYIHDKCDVVNCYRSILCVDKFGHIHFFLNGVQYKACIDQVRICRVDTPLEIFIEKIFHLLRPVLAWALLIYLFTYEGHNIVLECWNSSMLLATQ